MIENILKFYNSKYFPRIFYIKPDGGKDSGVTGYFLIEWKILFSIALLKFKAGSREAYHNHAFNAITWWIYGSVTEKKYEGQEKDFYPSFKPKFTNRENCHKIIAHKTSYCLTFRGPWVDYWYEIRNNSLVFLTHGRILIETAYNKVKKDGEINETH